MGLALGKSQNIFSVTISYSAIAHTVVPSCRAGLAESGAAPVSGMHLEHMDTQCSSLALHQSLTHTQLNSLPEGQFGVPDGHAEVDTTVRNLHTCEIESGQAVLPKHNYLLLFHTLTIHSPFRGIPDGQELVVSLSAWGLALSQPVDACAAGGEFGFTGQLHITINQNHFVFKNLLECRAVMESYEKWKEQRPSARFSRPQCWDSTVTLSRVSKETPWKNRLGCRVQGLL